MRTHTSIIFLVIALLGILSIITLGTLSYCAITGAQIQESLLTALIGIGGGLVGSLSSLLVNTRNQPTEPTPVAVTNEPVQVTPVAEPVAKPDGNT